MKENKTIITPKTKQRLVNIPELLKYKDLFYTLTWRDFRVRYAQTSIGLLWAVLQPLVSLLILSLVFGKFVGVKTEIPHLLFTVSGTCVWTYFSFVLTNSGNSIITNQNMIQKIYFPRLILPLSKAVVGFIDFGISLLIMIGLMFYYQIFPSENILFFPLFIFFSIIAALSIGIWLSALTVKFRDFQHVVPFIVQLGLYITPIAYPAEFAVKHLPNWAITIYYLNPMAGVIQGFRWCVFGGDFPGTLMYVSLSIVIIIFFTGLYYFRKIETQMSDFV